MEAIVLSFVAGVATLKTVQVAKSLKKDRRIQDARRGDDHLTDEDSAAALFIANA